MNRRGFLGSLAALATLGGVKAAADAPAKLTALDVFRPGRWVTIHQRSSYGDRQLSMFVTGMQLDLENNLAGRNLTLRVQGETNPGRPDSLSLGLELSADDYQVEPDGTVTWAPWGRP